MTVQDIITRVRAALDEDTAELWTDVQLFAELQDIDDAVYTKLADEHIWLSVKYQDYDFTADTASYALPTDFHKLIAVVDLTATPDAPVPHIEPDYQWLYEAEESGYHAHYIQGNRISFAPIPSASETSQRRLYYATHPARLTTGTAAAGAATSITLATTATLGTTSTENDYYNERLLSIHSGTGAGQTRLITDYVGSTKVATVATWATTPSTDSVYCIMPMTPANFHKVLADGIAWRACYREENPMGEVFRRDYLEGREDAIHLLRNRDSRFPRRLLRRPRYAI